MLEPDVEMPGPPLVKSSLSRAAVVMRTNAIDEIM